jgi:hypothetical protein
MAGQPARKAPGDQQPKTWLNYAPSVVLGAVTISMGLSLKAAYNGSLTTAVDFGLGGVAGLVLALVLMVYRESTAARARLDEAEREFDKQPERAKAVWDVAFFRLELYVKRNLTQVGVIFYVILSAMVGGFVLIGLGVWRIIEQAQVGPTALQPGVLVACSGVLVEFIVGTFLIIYKATLSQAQGFVGMLERINAVGMSAQLIEGADASAKDAKAEARLALARQLLQLYGMAGLPSKPGSNKNARRGPSPTAD